MFVLVKLLVVVRTIHRVEIFVAVNVLVILTHQKHQQLHVIVILFVFVRQVIVLVIQNIFVISLRLQAVTVVQFVTLMFVFRFVILI